MAKDASPWGTVREPGRDTLSATLGGITSAAVDGQRTATTLADACSRPDDALLLTPRVISDQVRR